MAKRGREDRLELVRVKIRIEGMEYQRVHGFIKAYNSWPRGYVRRQDLVRIRSIKELDERD